MANLRRAPAPDNRFTPRDSTSYSVRSSLPALNNKKLNKVIDRDLCGVRNKGLSMKAYLQDKTRYCAGKNPRKGSE